MELRQLRYFVTVARELNFTRAAEKLRVAQPALSRQVRQLEEELGVQLLKRDKRRVTLTSSGDTFLAEAEGILKQAEHAMVMARSEKKSLRVGYVWGLFHSIVPDVLRKLRVLAPDTSVHLFDMSAAQQSRALQARKIDAGFIGFALDAEAAHLEKCVVGATRFLVVLPETHPLARSRQIPLAKLASELFLMISDEQFPGARAIIESACANAGFMPRTLQTSERGHTMISLVAAGCGIALLPETLAALPHPRTVFRTPAQEIRAELFLAWSGNLPADARTKLVSAIHIGVSPGE